MTDSRLPLTDETRYAADLEDACHDLATFIVDHQHTGITREGPWDGQTSETAYYPPTAEQQAAASALGDRLWDDLFGQPETRIQYLRDGETAELEIGEASE